MDLDVKTKEEPICCEESSNTSCIKMDQTVEIKEEPVWFESAASISFDNCKITSEEIHFKEELNSELAEPSEAQPSTDIKDEICVDEHPVGQLVVCFKEDKSLQKIMWHESSDE
ncbi:uncharacterized protein [Anabrus simplex]|uniref:uncharacterized protein n=1 Tax=Anabrus simplex TaxID=316456 RepID=UPI0035A27093